MVFGCCSQVAFTEPAPREKPFLFEKKVFKYAREDLNWQNRPFQVTRSGFLVEVRGDIRLKMHLSHVDFDKVAIGNKVRSAAEFFPSVPPIGRSEDTNLVLSPTKSRHSICFNFASRQDMKYQEFCEAIKTAMKLENFVPELLSAETTDSKINLTNNRVVRVSSSRSMEQQNNTISVISESEERKTKNDGLSPVE